MPFRRARASRTAAEGLALPMGPTRSTPASMLHSFVAWFSIAKSKVAPIASAAARRASLRRTKLGAVPKGEVPENCRRTARHAYGAHGERLRTNDSLFRRLVSIANSKVAPIASGAARRASLRRTKLGAFPKGEGIKNCSRAARPARGADGEHLRINDSLSCSLVP